MDEIMKLNPVSYKMKDLDSENKNLGLIAQDLEKVIKEPVETGNGERKLKGVRYTGLIPVLINGMQEQQKQLKKEQAENDSLRGVLQDQQKQINSQQEQLDNQQEQINQMRERLNRLAQQKDENANRFKKSDNLNEKTVAISAEDGQRKAMLLQNRPNPYSGETVIPYYLPETFDNASMLITTLNGQVIKRIALENAGKGELTLRTDGLKAGQYLYSLILEGRKIQTRKMVVK
jgi:predicted RNase H-like nuclease (RuvC/YqgF family)